ncbi:phosphogluconate dehydrogenase (NAD(+)-dependent, decarboxylating) [Halodesulfovibrio aestuarii]|uniref:6-phosphogluconate dehydrogenase (Decarboxylating) n=1 Tax=Halodesulfovibrio aestuarii TaxID=126333 RepID=A0A8G2FBB8_9BACT|nr:decarboxylating 6-phosphogluconate dehydrogenase [Halodesulfovibrio aestuarii]SHJ29963.1 6-phosphogluconate dehydrogenase (decarboxylating) [Halodesulfovibrio aestuarii]
MQIAMIGLGRMGMNMARRLIQGGHQVVVWNRSSDKVAAIVSEGAIGAQTIKEAVQRLTPPRIIWCMLPSGNVTKLILKEVLEAISSDDLVIEGGNSYWKDDLENSKAFVEKGCGYIDAGVSGGVWGLKVGYCTMVGGKDRFVRRAKPIFDTLAPPRGWKHVGPVGSGHFIKMVHNGIEYAMMEAIGEGFDLMRNGPFEKLDLGGIADLWGQGSVVRSWLLELLAIAYERDPDLESIKGFVNDSGEGRWTILNSIEYGISTPVLAQSLFKRFESRQQDVYSNKVLAALRKEFGGHAVRKE